ncbi:MAG: hypothetical protein KGD58_18340 [Candidatus Lokiarchaeota archaeon]|nr:hypothetical protein [Candidatus Lokiarchaeota archaeon]
MSTELNDRGKVDLNYKKFLPLVKTRKGDFVFVPAFIYQSLLKETSLSKADAKKVTEHVVRFLKSVDLKSITASSIREVASVQMLKMGLEKEKLEFGQIGIPFYDLKKLLKDTQNKEYVYEKIVDWILFDSGAVDELINDYR